MFLRDREQHHRDPAQPVAEDHHLIVFVENVRWLAALDDLAKRAGVGHGNSTAILTQRRSPPRNRPMLSLSHGRRPTLPRPPLCARPRPLGRHLPALRHHLTRTAARPPRTRPLQRSPR